MARYELTDAQWDRIAYFFPHPTHWVGAGHPWHPHRPLVNGILWHLHTGGTVARCSRSVWPLANGLYLTRP